MSNVSRVGRRCEMCGVAYIASYANQRTCGRACGWALRVREGKVPSPRPPQPLVPKICTECDGEFGDDRPRWNRNCSEACDRAVSSREWALRLESLRRNRKCDQCSVEVSSGRRRCDRCKAQTARDAKRRRRHGERARRRGVRHERYTLAEIATRDRRMCKLCGKRVAMTQAVPHPKAPTIDHVLPIAAGGDDTRANVQLAHFICNSLKSDGGTQQLALVG